MKHILLIFSLCCLPTPFFGIGVAGLVAWAALTLLFRVADHGVEQMSEAAKQGNGTAFFWLLVTMAGVAIFGFSVLVLALGIAGGLRP